MHLHLTQTLDHESSGDELGVGLELAGLTGQFKRIGERGEKGAGKRVVAWPPS